MTPVSMWLLQQGPPAPAPLQEGVSSPATSQAALLKLGFHTERGDFMRVAANLSLFPAREQVLTRAPCLSSLRLEHSAGRA